MIAPTDAYLAAFADAGCDNITVHAEAGPHLDRSLHAIRELGLQAGVAINPATPESAIEYVLDRLEPDPGDDGEPGLRRPVLHPARWSTRWRGVKALIGERPIRIQVDGGIAPDTAPLVAAAGATVMVAGNAIFRGGSEDSYRANIAAIRAASDAAR